MQNIVTTLLFLIIFSSISLKAQVKTFTSEDAIFIQELNALVETLGRDDRAKAQQYLDTFTVVWNSDIMEENQKQWVYRTMNQFHSLRLKPWPDYALYLQGVIGVLHSQHAEINYDIWHQSFQSLLNTQNQRRLISYWEKSLNLFNNNIIYASSTVEWQLKDTNYILHFDDNVLKVEFSNNQLMCIAQGDSSIIYNTSGKVHLMEDILYGQQGKFTWERVELDPSRVFAQLHNYEIALSYARFEADSVLFHNYDFFQTPLSGKITDRLLAEVKPENANYPRFQSYQSIHEIKNIFPGIDFRGGFTMVGQRILGSSTPDGDAVLQFYRADSLFVTTRGNVFSIRNDRIIADRASMSIYLSGDSIYHPSVNTRYLHSTKELSFQRDERGVSRAPFYNTFHKIDMYCEAIYWNIDEYDIELRMIRGMSNEGEAMFESHDFFSDLRYMRMQALSGLHPLIRLRNFSNEYNSRTFPITEYARFARTDVANIKAQLISFSNNGFLTYNEDHETVTLHDRLFHYIGAYVGRNDFDVMQIHSVAPVNARINMNNFDLHLYGVERIPLSNEKNVVLHPANKEVIMKKNRDMYFDGRIESGLFDFFGKEFYFDYDKFKVNLVETDSMSFRVQSFERNSRGEYTEVRVRTVLEGINGELLVDHPNNKSGRLPYPRYPIFSSNNESYVYYDREFVQSGVYQRENVYFKLIPFSIDSLDNATTDNIAFDGVFISTGIFPDFYDYLTVQPDYSLGFNTKTPEEGYSIYDGKALYKGPIDMSYEGMRADGELQYLNSTIHANQMLMFPDSARAQVNTFSLTAQTQPIEYPEVKARDVNMLYKPQEDNMRISKTTHPIEMFGALAKMHGSIDLNPEGLTGEGRLDFSGAEIASGEFAYKHQDFSAKNSTLTIHSLDKSQAAIQATNYNAAVDLAQGSSQLKAHNETAKITFNMNRFEGYNFDFDWDMEAGTLKMENALHEQISSMRLVQPEEWITTDFSGHELVSIHPRQDSLRFFAGRADYDLADNTIHAQEVKIIKVADAGIFPHDEEVFILPGAEIKKLENSLIVANTKSMYHQFYNAQANITSRNQYTGSGMYDFIDERGNVQPIFFESISVDRTRNTTIANAEIEKQDDFTLSPRFNYAGEIALKAEDVNFYYKGASQILLDCGPLEANWVSFEAELDKDSIFIPLAEELRNDANGRITTSMMLAGDSIHIYPAIFNRQRHYSDIEIATAKGFLTYDHYTNQYLISTAERLLDEELPDNIIRINPNTCMVLAEGDINFGDDFGQFKIQKFGTMAYDANQDEATFDLVMGIDFYFLNSALAKVENSLRSNEDLSSINLNRRKYTSYLHKKTGKETSARLMDELALSGSFRRFPSELSHTFFFADLKMKWDQDNRTFYSTTPLGIGNMESFALNRYVEGFLEIKKHRAGDIFNMVIIPSGLADEGIGVEWFFFHYTNGVMQTIASETEFNNMIREVRPRRRRKDVERGETPFTFILSSDGRPFDFVRSMRRLLP